MSNKRSQQQQPLEEISGVRSMESKHKPLVILRCKVVIVGDACVGKTALTSVFHSGGSIYPKNYVMTTGVEFCVKQVPIENTNAIVELYLFDCAGQSIFNQVEMNAKYYENASAVMVVYDISNKSTLQAAPKWHKGVRGMRDVGPQIFGALVGNKSEFRDGASDTRAEVSTEDAQKVARELFLNYFEASAQHNAGVDEPFKYIAQEFYKRYEETISKAEDLTSNLAI